MEALTIICEPPADAASEALRIANASKLLCECFGEACLKLYELSPGEWFRIMGCAFSVIARKSQEMAFTGNGDYFVRAHSTEGNHLVIGRAVGQPEADMPMIHVIYFIKWLRTQFGQAVLLIAKNQQIHGVDVSVHRAYNQYNIEYATVARVGSDVIHTISLSAWEILNAPSRIHLVASIYEAVKNIRQNATVVIRMGQVAFVNVPGKFTGCKNNGISVPQTLEMLDAILCDVLAFAIHQVPIPAECAPLTFDSINRACEMITASGAGNFADIFESYLARVVASNKVAGTQLAWLEERLR